MSLLDDVSIVVTPNGYKAGELYAVIPVPTEGAEEVTSFTNGTTYPFTTFTTSGNNITSAIVSSAFAGTASNGISVTLGKIYKVTFDYTKNSGDDLRVLFAVSANGAASAISNSVIISESGTYTEYFTITSTTTGYLQMGTGNSGHSLNVSISNVSVKEYTSADMDVTRATAATRVDENGLVNYAEVIGGEDVVNGDFSNGTTGWVGNPETTLSVSNNELDIQSSSAASQYGTAFSNVNFELGKQYIVQLTVVSCNNPSQIRVGGSTSATAYSQNIWASGDIGIGTHSKVYTPSQNNAYLAIGGRNDVTTLVIDNVSVKQVDRDNVPRIDYTGGGCPHILAEPQRTNLVTYSEVISNLTLLTGGAGTYTITDNYTDSPEGVQNASRVQMSIVDTNDGANYSLIATNTTMVTGVTREISFYAKSLTGLNQEVLVYWSTAKQIVTLTNDWQRFEISGTSTNSGAVLIGTRGGTTQYYAGGDANLDFALWGLQVEDDGSGGGSSYATSYIPTSGSTVTRNQDIFTRDGIGSLINSTEGVLFVEMAALQ